jgi:acetyl-CoA C-acetyltransferase
MKAFEPVYIVDGARSPFLKSRNASALSRPATWRRSPAGRCWRGSPSPRRTSMKSSRGCAGRAADEVNIGRVIALRLGCGNKVPGWTVMRNCASGMQALDSAIANNIHSGRSQLVLAGGADALSRTPLLYSDKMVMWFSLMAGARTARAPSWHVRRGCVRRCC